MAEPSNDVSNWTFQSSRTLEEIATVRTHDRDGRKVWLCVEKRWVNALRYVASWCFEELVRDSIGLATRWLRILSLGGIDKFRNHLVANPISTCFYLWTRYFTRLIFYRNWWNVGSREKGFENNRGGRKVWLCVERWWVNAMRYVACWCFEELVRDSIGLATKWLRILSLGGIDKFRNHLVANPISTCFYLWTRYFTRLIFYATDGMLVRAKKASKIYLWKYNNTDVIFRWNVREMFTS